MKIKKPIIMLAFAVALMVPAVAYSQGSGSVNNNRRNNYNATRSVKGTVSAISESSITITTKKGKNLRFGLTSKTKYAKGAPKRGDSVKVVYRARDRRATKVRVQKKKQ